MKKVKTIGEKPLTPIEFIQSISTNDEPNDTPNAEPSDYDEIYHLGKSRYGLDLFAGIKNGVTYIYTGNLNDGVY
jgi:hypothetical protein